MKIFTYYKLANYVDSCYPPEIFNYSWMSKEAALLEAQKFLENIDLNKILHFSLDSRPVEASKKVEISEDTRSVKLSIKWEKREVKRYTKTIKKNIDNKEFHCEEQIEEVIKDWYVATRQKYKAFVGYIIEPEILEYVIFVDESKLLFKDLDEGETK